MGGCLLLEEKWLERVVGKVPLPARLLSIPWFSPAPTIGMPAFYGRERGDELTMKHTFSQPHIQPSERIKQP